MAETDGSGNTTAEYIFFGGKRVAMVPAGGSAQYYVEDFLGTSRVVTQSNGAVCYDADFTPFGGELPYTNSCPTQNNYKFEGKERDTETGNDDFGARYYSWRFGRWLSADWSAVPVPVPYANLTNPQTLNLYAMVADNPESFADLDGHDSDPAIGQGGTGGDNPGPPTTCVVTRAGCALIASDAPPTSEKKKKEQAEADGRQSASASTNHAQNSSQSGPMVYPSNFVGPLPPGAVRAPKQLTGDATEYYLPGAKLAYGGTYDSTKMAAAMTPDRARNGQTVTVSYTTKDAKGNPVTTTIQVVVNDTGPFARGSDQKALHPLRPDPKVVIDLTPTAMKALTGKVHNRVAVTVTVPNG